MQTAPQTGNILQFGLFEVDLRLGELRKGGVKVKVQDLPFRALRFLLDHPNEVLSREQFRQILWPEGVFVDFDHGISSAINRLRDALGDSADNPIFIETVERRGYRWIAPIHVPAPAAKPGPVLVQPPVAQVQAQQDQAQVEKLQKQVEVRLKSRLHWRWSLVFPAAALALAVWVVWPVHHAAKAGTTNSPALATTTAPELHARSARAEAEQFYLKGRFYWEKRTPEALNRALDYFTQAIVRDPNYAPAYVGLADCYNLLREYTIMPASDAYPRALAAAQRAVELDDQSSEAHASLAFALFWGNWDATSADHEFRRAIELNSNNAVAHHWYATYLAMVGRHSESLIEIERAQTLDPASKSILADKGQLLYGAGRRDEGISLLKQVEETEPNFISPRRYLKEIYFGEGNYPDYLKEWKQEATLLNDNSALKLVDAAEKGYAESGSRGMLQNVRALETKLYQNGSLSPYTLAKTDALLGNNQEALKLLKLAYDRHDESIINVKGDPAFHNLHNEPAYQDLVSRVSLPDNK
jgi:DNA-binding winged helix-turn-helix (wHTH) protein/Tfp pilus assembly protein PilF